MLNLSTYHLKRLQLKNLKKNIKKDEFINKYYIKKYIKSGEIKKNDVVILNDFHMKNPEYVELTLEILREKSEYNKLNKEFENIAKTYLDNVKKGEYIDYVEDRYKNDVCEDDYLSYKFDRYFDVYDIFKYHRFSENFKDDPYIANNLDKNKLYEDLKEQLHRDYLYFIYLQKKY